MPITLDREFFRWTYKPIINFLIFAYILFSATSKLSPLFAANSQLSSIALLTVTGVSFCALAFALLNCAYFMLENWMNSNPLTQDISFALFGSTILVSTSALLPSLLLNSSSIPTFLATTTVAVLTAAIGYTAFLLVNNYLTNSRHDDDVNLDAINWGGIVMTSTLLASISYGQEFVNFLQASQSFTPLKAAGSAGFLLTAGILGTSYLTFFAIRRLFTPARWPISPEKMEELEKFRKLKAVAAEPQPAEQDFANKEKVEKGASNDSTTTPLYQNALDSAKTTGLAAKATGIANTDTDAAKDTIAAQIEPSSPSAKKGPTITSSAA